MKTWHIENAAVALFLLGVWAWTECRPVELLGSVAVFCGFCCASISDRMVEREAARARPGVECYRKFWWFFWAKELAFASYFALVGAWSAIAGCVVFAAYPIWRKLWRRWHPLAAVLLVACSAGDSITTEDADPQCAVDCTTCYTSYGERAGTCLGGSCVRGGCCADYDCTWHGPTCHGSMPYCAMDGYDAHSCVYHPAACE